MLSTPTLNNVVDLRFLSAWIVLANSSKSSFIDKCHTSDSVTCFQYSTNASSIVEL